MIVLFLFCQRTALAQSDINQQVSNAILTSNAKELASVFAANLSLSLPGIEGNYSRTQAEMLLKDFFSHHKPTSFKISHSGQSREGAKYSVGKMLTASKKFNVYFLIKESNSQSSIIQFQVEETSK